MNNQPMSEPWWGYNSNMNDKEKCFIPRSQLSTLQIIRQPSKY